MIVHDFEDIAKALGKLLEEKQRITPKDAAGDTKTDEADAHLENQMGYDYCC